MAQSAAIYGLGGPELSAAEQSFFKSADPFGYILFQRNCRSRSQVHRLTDSLRSLAGRADLPILIDEEGGRVQRLKPPEWRLRPAMRTFGKLYELDPSRGLEAAKLNAQLIAEDLAELGITVDCIPCLDVPAAGSHNIIGDRAFSNDPAVVATLGRAVAEAIAASGILPVIKHIPGHGRATLDSHDMLPRVGTDRAELARTDFAPFRALADQPLAMTAHVVFESIDSNLCATMSDKVIANVIRSDIGFDGLLMSDDLSMKALDGMIGVRASRAIAAGCDIALHCNGRLDEMEEVAANVPRLAGAGERRAARARALLRRPRHGGDPGKIETRLKELLA